MTSVFRRPQLGAENQHVKAWLERVIKHPVTGADIQMHNAEQDCGARGR